MKKKTVQKIRKYEQLAKLDLIESETALFMAACEEFLEYQDTRYIAKNVSAQFDQVWNELTPKQQNELRPEFWGYATKYLDAPRKRPDMAYERFVEAYERRGFTSASMGIQIRPNEVIGFVYRSRSRHDSSPGDIDYRESLKRAIEWAAKIG